MTMSRELSRNQQRLAAIAAFGVFWGGLLVTIGFPLLPVAVVVLGLVGVAALALLGRPATAALSRRAHPAGAWVVRSGRAVDSAGLRAAHAAATRVGRIDWVGLRLGARRRVQSSAQLSRRVTTAVARSSVAGSGRAVAAARTANAVAEAQARTLRGKLADSSQTRSVRREAVRLNEQAAALRQEGKTVEALAAAERALEIFRALGDRRGQALTLNGVGLTQARSGDEAGAVDSYETAVSLLTELGDSHGAGRVLANLGAVHLGRGQEEVARAVWEDALERLEPGSPEHDRTAQQLRRAG
jgi:tetratricopeptide (TPR) repeat protein